MKPYKCKYCDKLCDPKEISRVYGKESRVLLLMYCSAAHYTRAEIINKRP